MGAKSNSGEKRNHKRVLIDAYVSAALVPKDVEHEKVFIAQDASQKGIFLLTNEEFPVGTLMRIEINLPSTLKPIEIEAKVARIAKDENGKIAGVGLIFTNISEPEKKGLLKHLYLAYHSRGAQDKKNS